MDLYCQNCGEPWEMYYVYNDMETVDKKYFMSGQGCEYCHGKPVKDKPLAASAMSALQDILGDDVDGIAAELEDLGF